MAFEIHPTQVICNEIGQSIVVVDSLTVNDGYITVGSYHVPLSQILFIKNIG
jgi:hypothetical protein